VSFCLVRIGAIPVRDQREVPVSVDRSVRFKQHDVLVHTERPSPPIPVASLLKKLRLGRLLDVVLNHSVTQFLGMTFEPLWSPSSYRIAMSVVSL